MLTRTKALIGAAIGAAVIVVIALVVVLAPRPADAPAPLPYAAPADLPPLATVPGLPGTAGLADAGWVDRVAGETGIPIRALSAYAGAAIAKSQIMPECGISWNTIAAIGAVESDHGRHDGSTMADDGTVSPPIYGVRIGDDSDGGEFDGAAKFDRAAGPMQFIPESWHNWRTDANGDGLPDVQNIDDAAMATANYLCRVSSDMVGPNGWRAGIAGYNSAPSYAVAVASEANAYADAASTTP
jgi:membrane-bound lytic murein transglycosylase B